MQSAEVYSKGGATSTTKTVRNKSIQTEPVWSGIIWDSRFAGSEVLSLKERDALMGFEPTEEELCEQLRELVAGSDTLVTNINAIGKAEVLDLSNLVTLQVEDNESTNMPSSLEALEESLDATCELGVSGNLPEGLWSACNTVLQQIRDELQKVVPIICIY